MEIVFKVGDVVQLNSSDSPKMTVSYIADQGTMVEVKCLWYSSEKGKFDFELFDQRVLKKYQFSPAVG